VRSFLFPLLFAIASAAGAAPYACPAPASPSALGCTFRSVGGTTTFTAGVGAFALGNAQSGSLLALEIDVDSQPCFNNFNDPVTFQETSGDKILASSSTSGICTFQVTSKRPVELVAVSGVFNAIPTFIQINAFSVAFAPDFHLDVSATGNGVGTITSSDGAINCGSDCSETYLPAATVTLSATAALGSNFTGWGGACSGTQATCVVLMSETKNVTANFVRPTPMAVVEFYHAASDHYFITGDEAEAAAIDAGAAGPGWARTGYWFYAGGNVPVCRFYGSLSPGPNSHFYTARAEECNFLKQLQATTPSSVPRWNFEGTAFATSLPVGGQCPQFTVPVYRAYNDGVLLGKDSNHRITSSPNALQEVIARGWRFEGTAMCAPQ
jgi:hypothetical protein